MTLELHDEIKRVAHAIISEYIRSYPAMPHTEVLADFVDRLEFTVMKLRRLEGAAPVSAQAFQVQAPLPDDTSQGTDPNASPTPHTAISNEAPAGAVQTSGFMSTDE
jgi:hypothetical protein